MMHQSSSSPSMSSSSKDSKVSCEEQATNGGICAMQRAEWLKQKFFNTCIKMRSFLYAPSIHYFNKQSSRQAVESFHSLKSLPSSFLIKTMADVVPPSIDYRYLLRLKDRKEQRLGTCWACATAAMLEVRLQRDGFWDDLPSIQNMINCCKCNGGTNNRNCSGALDFILRHGLATEDDCHEKRHGAVRRACRNCNSDILSRIRITGHGKVHQITEVDLQLALRDHGAICVGVTVGPLFHKYTGGITRKGFHHPDEAGPGITGHYLTLVGYNNNGNVPYWILLNSHSPGWGEDGCIRLHRDQTFRFETARYITGASVIPSA